MISGVALSAGSVPQGTDIVVRVTDVRSSQGVVRACMTSHAESFPRCRGADGAYAATAKAGDGITLTFHNVTPGRYAIALLHDENGNGKADRAAMMIPTEGFGFSRDAKVRMGPPRFNDAAFEVKNQAEHLSIRMRYML